MFLEAGTEAQLLTARDGDEDLLIRVGPVEADGGGVGDEELVEGDGRAGAGELVAHAGEGEVVDPGGVRVEELAGPGGGPAGEPVVVFECWGDAVAHYEEHDVAG